jgi:O-antigen ligase
MIAVAMGFFLYLKKSVPNVLVWRIGIVLLIGGLISPLARGPWIGAAVILLIFALTAPNRARDMARLVFIGVAALPLMMVTPVGKKILAYLPWVGTAETQTVDFREELFERSIAVIKRNPYFGSFDYLSSSELQELATGRGLIDIVNTYVGIALLNGLVGLFLFLGIFVTAIYRIFKAMQRLADRSDEHYLLGQALLSVQVGILVMIGTVSSILTVPTVYWSVVGLGVAYVRMIENKLVASANPLDAEKPAGPNYIARLSR